MDTNDTFWMIKGDGPTNYVHTTEESARQEARRLARENPGTRFYVLQATKAFFVNDIIEIDLDTIPF